MANCLQASDSSIGPLSTPRLPSDDITAVTSLVWTEDRPRRLVSSTQKLQYRKNAGKQRTIPERELKFCHHGTEEKDYSSIHAFLELSS